MAKQEKTEVFTIGHSTRSKEEFLSLLEAHHIQVLFDVRSLPGSNMFPHFNSDRLKTFLKKRKISYFHMPGLGGRRRPKRESTNQAWRSASFRGYADYMETDEFKKSLERVIKKAEKKNVVLMCAEAVPWRCHRSLIGDSLLVKGVKVFDIMTETRATPHKLPAWAKISTKAGQKRLSYP